MIVSRLFAVVLLLIAVPATGQTVQQAPRALKAVASVDSPSMSCTSM